jgi:hypothetical protein
MRNRAMALWCCHLWHKGSQLPCIFRLRDSQLGDVNNAIIAPMKVWITLNKMGTGRVQLECLRSTNESGRIGRGGALPPFNPNAMAEILAILKNMGVDEDLAAEKIALIRDAAPGEVVKVEDRDVPDDVLRENGFVGF